MKEKLAALEAGWVGTVPLFADPQGLTVWHRHEGGSVHSFKYEVEIPTAPGPCVALAKETDLMPSWHKFVPCGAVLGGRADAQVFGGIYAYAEVWMPWPLKNRGVVCHSAFFDCLEDPDVGAYLVDVSSVAEAPGDAQAHSGVVLPASLRAKLPSTEEEVPRLGFQTCTSFKPLPAGPGEPQRTLWTFYFHRTDYQVELPSVALGFLMKICAPFVRSTAIRLARDPPAAFQDRMNPGSGTGGGGGTFYGVLGRRCAQHALKLSAELFEDEGDLSSGPRAPRHVGLSRCGSLARRQISKAPLKRPSLKPQPSLARPTSASTPSLELAAKGIATKARSPGEAPRVPRAAPAAGCMSGVSPWDVCGARSVLQHSASCSF